MPAEKDRKRAHCDVPPESDRMCCINELPDELLVNIVSNLDVKEAARTCVLSRKWRTLWTLNANLDFDCTWRMLWKHLDQDRKKLKSGVHKFMECVSHVLDIHRGSTLDRLRIAFNMQYYCPCIQEHMAKWVDFAIVKRVRILYIDMSSAFGFGASQSACDFPSWLLSIPLDLPCFDRLTALCLSSVSISDAELAYFLSSCPLLEHLSVRNARALKNVRVSGEALRLNQLELSSNLNCGELEHVEVGSAPNLTSFKYGWSGQPTAKLCFTDVPKLSSISLRIFYCEHSIFKLHNDLCLSRIKKLELGLSSMEHDRCLNFPRIFPEFNNLEDLQLKFVVREDENILFLNSIIGASPCLHKLTLEYKMIRAHPEPKYLCEEIGGRFTHQCLQEIQFVGWNGVQTEGQLADYLIKSCPQLEKFIIDLHVPEWKETVTGYRQGGGNLRDREDALINAKQFQNRCLQQFPKARFFIIHHNFY